MIEDRSSGNSISIIQEYRKNGNGIIKWQHTGASSARNVAIEAAAAYFNTQLYEKGILRAISFTDQVAKIGDNYNRLEYFRLTGKTARKSVTKLTALNNV